MRANTLRLRGAIGLGALLLAGLAPLAAFLHEAQASWPFRVGHRHDPSHAQPCGAGEFPEGHGTWYWLRSPEQERRVITSHYNRYCVRCHAVDGRGVWDIPDVPDFTSTRWQACRSDAQLTRIILEGRGAVMPAFRGTLTLEEAWAMARYLRSFVPGSEASRPNDRDAAPPAADSPSPLRK